MTIKFKDDGGTSRTITAIKFKDDGGTDRTISQIKYNDKVIFTTGSPLSVGVSPASVGGDALGTGNATSGASTATPTGGTAPYTYLWTLEDETGSGTPSINSATSATSAFSVVGLPEGEFCSATGRCTVTDANSFSASGTCLITFYGGTSRDWGGIL